MLNAVNVAQQDVNSGANVLFANTRYSSRRCTCNYGWLNHVEGSGLFTLTNRSNCPMTVEVEFNGNVSANAAGATALAVELNGSYWWNRNGLYSSYSEHISERGSNNGCNCTILR